MSHFTVLIATVGDTELGGDSTVESILAPFDENIEADPRWEDADLSWSRKYFASDEFKPEGDQERLKADATDDELVEWLNAYHDGDERYRVVDGKFQRETTYNPDSKWDWYQVGGRWTGGLLLKQGSEGVTGAPGVMTEPNFDPDYADQAFKRDIAIDAMRQHREDEAQVTWSKWQAIVDEHGTPKSFQQILDEHGLSNERIRELRNAEADKKAADETYKPVDCLNPARTEYHAQPAVVAAKEQKLVGEFFDSVDEKFLAHTKDSYIENATLGALCGYAYLSEETGWLQAGEMGWFGMGTDTPLSTLEYRREVLKHIDSLPDDAVLTFVDCHI
jgi:hypothetical protein